MKYKQTNMTITPNPHIIVFTPVLQFLKEYDADPSPEDSAVLQRRPVGPVAA